MRHLTKDDQLQDGRAVTETRVFYTICVKNSSCQY